METINSFHPVWGATSAMSKAKCRSIFQSTLPVGGATHIRAEVPAGILISIHAPRGGSDVLPRYFRRSCVHFNPRSPWGERPIKAGFKDIAHRFQSTLPVGGATAHLGETGVYQAISIHAPRGGSDHARVWADRMLLISIHAPRGGSALRR